MPDLTFTPVDHDPYVPAEGPILTPVEENPFAPKRQHGGRVASRKQRVAEILARHGVT